MKVCANFVLLFLTLVACCAQARAETYDLVVYGGTSAGVTAAVQASRMGKSVVLVEPSQHLGGLTTGGLGLVDSGNPAAVGGLAREFYHRLWKHYQQPGSWKWEKPVALVAQHGSTTAGDETFWVPEPSAAEKVIDQMIAEAKVTVLRGERLERQRGVRQREGRIVSIVMESGRELAGRMFLDTTYEGDLMAAAGVSYFVGRESNRAYGETMNGIRPMPARAAALKIDPYRVKGRRDSGLLPRVHAELGGAEFEEDRGVQAFCYRMCLTDVPANRLFVPKPEGYDEIEYELVFRYMEAGAPAASFFKLSLLPNRKTDSNNNGPFSTDYIGKSWDWPEADYATREKIAREHELWQRGLIWTLQNHPRVPEAIRAYYAPWGLPKDEFTDNGHWPHQLYVREARRLVADIVITEQMALGQTPAPHDSVGLASYAFDSHAIKYYVDATSGFVTTDGALLRPPQPILPPTPFAISYRSIIPKRAECKNLFVPVCLSATHVTYGSIRMEPVFMILGQSAATAAVLAIDEGVAVQDLSYDVLRKRLLSDQQAIEGARLARPKDADADGFAADLRFLRDKGIITSVEYWADNARPHGLCEGEWVAELVRKAAANFQPATTLDGALQILSEKGVVSSVEHWRKATYPGSGCKGEDVAALLRKLALRLRQNG